MYRDIHRYGDLNCQKLFGCSTSLYGLISTIISLIQFRGNCGLLSSLFVFPWASTDTLDVFVDNTGAVGVVDVVLRWMSITLSCCFCFKEVDTATTQLCSSSCWNQRFLFIHSAGPGYVMLFIAIVLKGYDAMCHLIVPTPREKNRQGRSKDRDWAELSSYMKEATDGVSSLEGDWSRSASAPLNGGECWTLCGNAWIRSQGLFWFAGVTEPLSSFLM